jgi:hypothetical protein
VRRFDDPEDVAEWIGDGSDANASARRLKDLRAEKRAKQISQTGRDPPRTKCTIKEIKANRSSKWINPVAT